MNQDEIDASIGLAFSLKLFQHYRRSGLLQAQVRHVPGVHGACNAYLYLTDGVVDTCYVEDKQGQRRQFSVDALCHVDNEKGPFEWVFRPQTSEKTTPSPSLDTASSLSSLSDNCVPVVIAPLHGEQLHGWTSAQKQMLHSTFDLIDGKRTIQEIKACLAFAPQVVDEELQMLHALRVITISSS